MVTVKEILTLVTIVLGWARLNKTLVLRAVYGIFVPCAMEIMPVAHQDVTMVEKFTHSVLKY